MENNISKNLEIFCMCLYDHYLENLFKILNYKNVGLGNGKLFEKIYGLEIMRVIIYRIKIKLLW